MKYKTLDDIDVKGKVVFVRVDLNSELNKGKPVISDRIREHSRTIKELVKKKAKVVVLSYQGRKGDRSFSSLREHAKLVGKIVKVRFVADVCGDLAKREISSLQDGEAILLENTRFEDSEKDSTSKSKIVKNLSGLGEVFVSDAFSVAHRDQASVSGLAKVIKEKCIGRVMERELENIGKLKVQNGLFILGGAKYEDNLLLLGKGKVVTTGVFSLLGLMADGVDLGLESERLKKEKKVIVKLKRSEMINPIDLAIKKKGKRRDIVIDGFPQNSRILDIGIKTIEMYEKEIMKAKRVFWKGSAGYAEDSMFGLGTKRLMKAMEKSKAFCVIAGGHSSTAVEKYGIRESKLGYVSLSGGALVHYLAGKKLPGLEVLK